MSSDNIDLPAQATIKADSQTTHANDDAATIAPSEELEHTTISDEEAPPTIPIVTRLDHEGKDEDGKEFLRERTPDLDLTSAQDEDLKEKLTSPKKKRGRDTYDESKELEGPGHADSSAEGDGVNGSRLEREGPEKKRHRDTSEGPSKTVAEEKGRNDSIPSSTIEASKSVLTNTKASTEARASALMSDFSGSTIQQPHTSASSFAKSGFSSLASSAASPFATIGASKPSIFGSKSSSSTSGFASLGTTKPPTSPSTTTKSGLGSFSGDKPMMGFGFGSTSTSSFGALGNDSIFGSALNNGFAGGSRPKLSTFAAPGKNDMPFGKPARAFGAPESDEEDLSDEEGSDKGAKSNDEKDISEEKKRSRATKAFPIIPVEDGESGEATLLQLRAKLFALDSKEAGWKERGVGTLKINVPKSCASFDENGLALPGSFDASGVEDEGEDESSVPRVPRLIMRQENTHRVILNTIIVRAMEFKDKPTTSAAQIIFTAFEGEKEPKPINLLFKMSETNARLFRSEIESIQHEL